jgi:hypothetical protein
MALEVKDEPGDHRRQSFGSAVLPVKFSKMSNIDQRAALPSRHSSMIAARLLVSIGDRAPQ